jgi:hypothetical protein
MPRGWAFRNIKQCDPPPHCRDTATQQSVVFSLRIIYGDLEQEALGVKTPFTVLYLKPFSDGGE